MSAGEFMLTERLKEATWTLQERQTAQYARGGASQIINLGTPFWMVSLTYENLGPDEYRALTAWIARRQGAAVTFAARRPGRAAPFAADPVGTTVAISSGKLRVNTGATHVRVGDMVSYTTATGRYVGEVLATTDAGGNNIDCTMRPAPLAVGSPSDIAIVGAWGLFRMDPTSLQVSETYDPRKRVSFSARQVEP